MSSGRLVLVVDDDPSMLAGINRLLARHGFPTRIFTCSAALFGHDDLRTALCLILDVNLKEISGFDVHRRLAQDGIALPVIYITGNDSEAYRRSAMDCGCLEYLTKPFSAAALITAVRKADDLLA